MNRSRPLLVRAFKEDNKEPAQKQEVSTKSSSASPPMEQQQQMKDVAARTPLQAYEMMPFRRMNDVMAQMQREMDAMMDVFGISSDIGLGRTSPFSMLERMAPRAGPSFGRVVPFDMVETDNQYQLKLEVPGFSKGDIKVSLDQGSNMVTISGQKEAQEGGAQSHMAFSRSFSLPQNVDFTQDIKARTEHGILTLELPKAALPASPAVKEIAVEGQ